MFGIGFTEILLISIIAILFLGPDKLPEAMIQIAKFIKGVKKTVGEAKSSLEEEMKIADLKEEALNYKQQLDNATNELKSFKNIDFDDLEDITYDKEVSPKESPYAEAKPAMQVEPKSDTVTFKKKSKKKEEPKADNDTQENNKKTDETKGDA
jgi:sec-independent protein translocase protein TatB